MIPHLRASWLDKILAGIPTRLATKFRLGQDKYKCDIGTWTDSALRQHIQEEVDDTMLYLAEQRRREELVSRQDAVDLAHMVIKTLTNPANESYAASLRNKAHEIVIAASLQ